jgi:hypothetical protein
MNKPTAYHQIGQFIVFFQHVESALTELLVLMSQADDEAIRILVNELKYAQRVKTTGVLFARFVDLQRKPDPVAKDEFSKLMSELLELGERRNELVHSKYTLWFNVQGAAGVLRENSKLRASKGVREIEEEKLLPEAFSDDLKRLSNALNALERFRLKVIDWRYPDEQKR